MGIRGAGRQPSFPITDLLRSSRMVSSPQAPRRLRHPSTDLRHRGGKRRVIVGGAVLAVVIGLLVCRPPGVLGWGSRSTLQRPPLPARQPAEPTAAAGPWQAYDFVAKALPGLMPDTPVRRCLPRGYLSTRQWPDSTPLTSWKRWLPWHGSCAGPLGERSPATSLTTSLSCSSDRTPQTLAGVRRRADCQRATNSGRVGAGQVRSSTEPTTAPEQWAVSFRQPGAKTSVRSSANGKRRHQRTGRIRPTGSGMLPL